MLKPNIPVHTYLFFALVVWLPLPLGSNRAWAWSLMEAWVFILFACVLLAWYRNKLQITPALRAAKPILLILAVFNLWLIIQVIPLPIGWVQILSPQAAAVYLSAFPQAEFIALSLDVHSSAISLLKSLAYMMFFWLALMLIDNRRKLEWLAYVILVGALFQASYGTYMVIGGGEFSFFLKKEDHLGLATGTFLNRNHFAGYLEMSLAVGIGLFISTLSDVQHHSWRARIRSFLNAVLSRKGLIRLMLIIICAGLIMSRSRMGNAAFFISLLFVGVLFLLTAKHATKSTSILLLSLIVLDVVLVGSWVGVERVVERMEHTSTETETRVEVARDTMLMIKDYPLTGVGGGNYFSSFPAYRGHDIQSYYNHTHNDYLELLSEFGAVGMSLLVMVVLLSLFSGIRAIRRRSSPLLLGMAFASVMGTVSILIHSTVDFNLQIPSNAMMFMLMLALDVIALHMPNKGQSHRG
ncbi:MAG: O-antigen ligase family protein [Mariprofundus sp.]|nr:O-antigen ligase family protein [Mariprofundus sp.]